MPAKRKAKEEDLSALITDARKLPRPDGDKRLSDCTLREAVESVYATFASTFRGFGYPSSKKFFEEDIPAMVFDVAVTAGWILVAMDAFLDEKSPELQGRRLISFGGLMIEPWYREAFIALLEDEIAYHSHDPTDQISRMEALPRFTSKSEREALLHEYLKKHAMDKVKIGITDIPVMAAVDYSDFKKWRKGPRAEDARGLPDSSIKAKRIAILLRFDERTKKPKHKSKWELSPP
jgi:hypothetical protein